MFFLLLACADTADSDTTKTTLEDCAAADLFRLRKELLRSFERQAAEKQYDLLNLLVNACKFSEPGARVTVSCERGAAVVPEATIQMARSPTTLLDGVTFTGRPSSSFASR